MKKQVLNLGKALNKAEQKQISGGVSSLFASNQCNIDADCCHYKHNQSYGYVCSGSNVSGSGVCVPGIFYENPCGL